MGFEPDWATIRESFRLLKREALLEELALRIDDYTSMARKLLEGEALARGITATEIAAAREGPPPMEEAAAVDHPQLLTSTMEREPARELTAALRKQGIPALVRELETYTLRHIGCEAGRWGIFVPGLRAAEAGRILDALFPPQPEEACADATCAACAVPPPTDEDPWPEDGDWWKTGIEGNESGDKNS